MVTVRPKMVQRGPNMAQADSKMFARLPDMAEDSPKDASKAAQSYAAFKSKRFAMARAKI